MSRCRFVQPEAVRVDLSDGDWMDVKKRLSIGEQRAIFASLAGKFAPDGSNTPSFDLMGMADLAAYLVAWSLKDAQGLPVQPSLQAIKQLHIDDFRELDVALAAHKATVEEENAAAKKSRDGVIESSTILPSVA